MGLKRIALLLVALIALTVGVTACGGSDDDSSSATSGGDSTEASSGGGEKGPILIGATLGLTGALSFYDKPFIAGTEAAIEDFNEEGGIEGREIKLVKNDNASEIDQIVPKAQEIIEKEPVLLLTSNSDTTGIPAAKAAQEAGQLVMGASGPTTYGSQIGNLVYNDWHGNPTEAGVATEFAEKQGWKKVIVVEDLVLGYTKDIAQLFEQSFGDASPDNEVVTKVSYNASGTDTTFPSQVTDIRSAAAGADAIFLSGLVTDAPTLMKEMRSAGIDLPIFGFGGGLDGDFWTEAVPNLGTFYSNSVGAIEPDGGSTYASNPNTTQNELLDRVEKNTGERPIVGHTYTGYTVIQMLAEAMKMTGGSTDSEELAGALDEFDEVPTLVGYTTYTPECHVPSGRNLAITEIVKGKGKYLETITPKPENVPVAPC